MLQLGGGIVPYSVPQALATTAVALSAVNISGGFLVTNKMLDMFRRPTDPPEYWHYYLIPTGVATAGFATAVASGACPENLVPALGLASGLTCIGAIASMSSQSTSRAAPTLAASGIGMGFATALASMHVSPSVYGQLALFGVGGAYAGRHIANKVFFFFCFCFDGCLVTFDLDVVCRMCLICPLPFLPFAFCLLPFSYGFAFFLMALPFSFGLAFFFWLCLFLMALPFSFGFAFFFWPCLPFSFGF
jgi:hypothetical protein